MNYVDIFIGGTLVLAVFRGWSRGILLTFARIAGYLAGLAVAVYYFRFFAAWLDQKFGLVERVGGFLYNLLPLPKATMTAAIDSLGLEELAGVVETLPLPAFYQEQMITYFDNYQLMLAGSIVSIGETIALLLAHTLVEVLAFGLLLVGTMVLVRRVGRLISRQAGKSAFDGLNRIAGALLGLVTGVIVVAIGLGLLVPVVVLGQVMQLEFLQGVGTQVSTSLMVPYFLEIFTLFQASAGGVLPFADGIF